MEMLSVASTKSGMKELHGQQASSEQLRGSAALQLLKVPAAGGFHLPAPMVGELCLGQFRLQAQSILPNIITRMGMGKEGTAPLSAL